MHRARCGPERPKHSTARWWPGAAALLLLVSAPAARAAEAPPAIEAVSVQDGQVTLVLPKLIGIEAWQVEGTPELGEGFEPAAGGPDGGYQWRGPATEAAGFYRLRGEALAPEAIWAVVAMNRLAYGPTPDLLERVLTGPAPIGAAAFIEEQLAPESLPDTLDVPLPPPEWQFVNVTGVASSSIVYLYLPDPGDVYLDDLTLVAGSVPAQGPNLVRNGDFEAPLAGTWTVSTNLAASHLSTDVKRSGQSALHLVASSGGTTRSSALWQVISPALKVGQTYTLSYWYLPSTNGTYLTARLSNSGNYPGRGIDTTHSLVPGAQLPGWLHARLQAGVARVDDLRAWYLMHAVRSERQLLQTLLQFTDNHFVTQYSKSREWVDGRVTNSVTPSLVATEFEFRELLRWREVWLNPHGTFLDLLRVSAESPTMIIYLDTVTSRGGNANENYSRELLELFTMGVDNGYDQTDIEQMSRAWTGWRVDKLPPEQAHNPFASPVANRDTDPGVWTLRYRADRHDNGAKVIFRGKTVPARFGPPHVGRSYELRLPARSGNAGMQDGYDILNHLANLPQTREFISVKLCRWFVHEHFHHGLYDYTAPDLGPEGRLVRACMEAWETPGPDGRPGNLRQVLRVIFHSELFRSRAALAQKVKTPLEYVVSTVRALRAARPEGGFTADTDGYDLITSLRRLNMPLFDRADPDGWPETGRDWISTAALIERMRFAQNFLIAPRDPLKQRDFGVTGDDNVSDPVALLRQRLPADRHRDPAAVAAFFLRLYFPGEGRANWGPDRELALAFLNSADSGVPGSSPFAALLPASTAYDNRVRGLVALLLGLPRFQEQ